MQSNGSTSLSLIVYANIFATHTVYEPTQPALGDQVSVQTATVHHQTLRHDLGRHSLWPYTNSNLAKYGLTRDKCPTRWGLGVGVQAVTAVTMAACTLTSGNTKILFGL